jgi:type IV/VI secretion system ImpK/VasF family protein
MINRMAPKINTQTDVNASASVSVTTAPSMAAMAVIAGGAGGVGASFAGANKLADAALPLLGLAVKLKELAVAPDKIVLRALLVRQIEVFVERVYQAVYNEEIIVASRYAVCALIDELVIDTSWGATLHWEQDGLLKHFTNELPDGKKFFTFLKSAQEKVAANTATAATIDLLELMYLCLNLGYIGKYRSHKKGGLALNELINEVYKTLLRYRKSVPRRLLVGSCGVAATGGGSSGAVATAPGYGGEMSFAYSRPFFSRVMWLVITVALLVCGGTYLFLNSQLNNIARPLTEGVKIIDG